MKQNLGIKDKVSFAVGRPAKKTPLLKRIFNIICSIPVRIVQRVRRKTNDEEHPVNSHD
tara:strand:- start:25 stop:201 length:177 start_codon:yes stop_codon:yes gene_type:complete